MQVISDWSEPEECCCDDKAAEWVATARLHSHAHIHTHTHTHTHTHARTQARISQPGTLSSPGLIHPHMLTLHLSLPLSKSKFVGLPSSFPLRHTEKKGTPGTLRSHQAH